MPTPEFAKWSGVLWKLSDGHFFAYCPKHKYRLDVISRYNSSYSQLVIGIIESHLLCAIDDEIFQISGSNIATMRRRFEAVIESDSLKSATYRDLDNIYTPVLKVNPKPKDDKYSIQVEIDDTPQGKKMVIYAADRSDLGNKAQIFIDPQTDKISFDSNDLHPNMIFSKVIAYFKDGKKAELSHEEEAK